MILSDDQLVWSKAFVLFAVTRWLLSILINRLNRNPTSIRSSDSCGSSTQSSPSSCSNLRTMKKNVSVTMLQMIEHKLLLDDTNEVTCAVCLNKLKKKSKVYDLGNCCHVFHKQCLERWISYDERLTCPLCRAFLVRDTQHEEPEQASWAVEKMLYLFGDDLIIQ